MKHGAEARGIALTFLMVECSSRSWSFEGSSSDRSPTTSRYARARNLCTPSTPFVFQACDLQLHFSIPSNRDRCLGQLKHIDTNTSTQKTIT